MALSPDERRFLKNWEEQRKDGRTSFVGTYTFGLFILFYMGFIAVGLFAGWPFLKRSWLVLMALGALLTAFGVAWALWKYQQKKFSAIIRRELSQSEHLEKN
ncbi:MAG: hypothetical protein MUE71_09690 [Chitinophagaceae bacterium]|jgi:peptidoglycan/LPS O-acetylase OafA/YrhL|nr:hypothetical protein [Chitinophagaceae bacterium]MCU0404090.1 hypothetical protein [Chitinophagaceae bacterium]